ncbi:hypothetical protein [Streptomyces sp. NPDC086989]|uniref:hypothetical protein n=1 Tax=Streptomyces sp. NPDC086989 TaxID=3365764 RepID=UPI00381E1E3B
MTLLNRLRILASHARRGLHAECPTDCSEGHTYRVPCAWGRRRFTPTQVDALLRTVGTQPDGSTR